MVWGRRTTSVIDTIVCIFLWGIVVVSLIVLYLYMGIVAFLLLYEANEDTADEIFVDGEESMFNYLIVWPAIVIKFIKTKKK